MKTAFFAYSEQGKRTAFKISAGLNTDGAGFFTSARLADGAFSPLPAPSYEFFAGAWEKYDALIFVCACGIAVRQTAPHIKDKTTDPAVICTDELGRFVIPLLSGHIGGANELAVKIAEITGGAPVVTTATDVNGRFAVDVFARERGYIIDDMKAAKAVSAAVLAGDVYFCTDLAVKGELPAGLKRGDTGDVGIYLGAKKISPFGATLRLIPKTLVLGIGCRRGTGENAIRAAVESVFEKAALDIRAVKAVCSIDLKKDEKGLLAFCESLGVSPVFYTADELMKASGDFTPSEFVKSVTGADNVCERAAALCAGRAPFIKKTALGGVTVALSEINAEVVF